MTTSAPALWPAAAWADRTFSPQCNRGRPAARHSERTAATLRGVVRYSSECLTICLRLTILKHVLNDAAARAGLPVY
jgi:hypothetical protein